MIKAVVFDVGEVLLKEKNGEIEAELWKKLGRRNDKAREIILKYLNRAISRKEEDFWLEKKIAKRLNLDPNQLINLWMNLKDKYFEVNRDVEKIIAKLKKNKYTLVSLTDVNYSHEIVRRKMNVYSMFDINLKSFELKTRKPLKKFYKVLLKRTKLKPEEIIFIDDFPLNLETPKKMGIKPILFIDALQLKKDLIKLGVKLK